MAIPTLIAYFIYKTKFGTIVAEVGLQVKWFSPWSVQRGGFEEGEAEGEYYEDPAAPAPGAISDASRLILNFLFLTVSQKVQRGNERV